MDALSVTNIPELKLRGRGKVRDIYDLPHELLVVTTDRISAFDRVLPDPIPGKGEVLTAMSTFWFDFIERLGIPHHLLSADTSEIIGRLPQLEPYRDQLEGRTMLVRKANPFPVEGVVRGYLAGSGWKSYRANGKVCGNSLPAGLRESEKLPQIIFTPTTKAETGHDESIDFGQMAAMIGKEISGMISSASIEVYEEAQKYAAERGIIIADTKFEFGELRNGQVILIDEILTPDSSRFWPADDYQPGRSQASFDKQFVRDYLTSLGWDGGTEAPNLPPDIIEVTSAKYREIRDRLLA